VRILDQGRVGGAASHGNCGTLTPSHAPPLAVPGMTGQALALDAQPVGAALHQAALGPGADALADGRRAPLQS
jgi:hypothetical protein